MPTYRLELIVESQGAPLSLVGETSEVFDAYHSVKILELSFRNSDRDLQKPTIILYRDGTEISQFDLKNDWWTEIGKRSSKQEYQPTSL